ncbi:MAG: SurA N-terminal domain-containing protein [Chitinophagaceae bacterium]|nr:SurA N-terminal domain-containing protein [Chitinophagaceae bacterium]
MSIIQTIRDRAAWIITGAIALALIAFIVQDSFHSSNLFGGQTTTMGTVNGKKIEAVQFEERYKRAEDQYRQAGYPLNDMMRQNIRESLWNEYVDDAIMQDKYQDLGISVSDAELSDILYGDNPPQDLRQQFTDPNTGQYDVNAAYQQIQALRKQKNTPMYESFFNQYLPALRKSRQKEKYLSLLSHSLYIPKWMVEKANADNTKKASIAYVMTPYSTVSDSAVKVTDQTIAEYVNLHKNEYKQDASRNIEYVMFDASPTSEDSAAVLAQTVALKEEFIKTDDDHAFLVRNGSESNFTDAFEMKSDIRSEKADSIIALAAGQVLGPYQENGSYVMAKMLEKRVIPDSVKVRHILVKSADQSGISLDDAAAKKRIDSVVDAIRRGANFDSLVVKVSDDAGSKNTGGVYEFSSRQMPSISKEFAETAFYGKAGDKKTVRVENPAYTGYHYIEVLQQKKFEPAYKIAIFSKPILPSDETINREMGLASQFAGESRDKKQFDENVRKHNYNKIVASEIKPLDAMIMGLGSSRELVKWAYDAKPGAVADIPFQVEDKFVVPVVTQIFEEGVMSPQKARPLVESILLNQEKAKQIAAKIGSAATLEAVAQATGQTVAKEDSIMFSSFFIPNVGQEYKVIGAAFNKDFQNKISPPITGNLGVYVIKTEGITEVPNANLADIGQQQLVLKQNKMRAFSNPMLITEILKKTVTIKDNRYKFF